MWIDHKGQEFELKKEMCEHWKVQINTFDWRIKRGWTTEEALTGIKIEESYIDHEGTVFNTLTEMCNNWGISRQAYLYRLKQGLTKEQALTYDKDKGKSLVENLNVFDHKGIGYKSIRDMCDAYKITLSIYYSGLKHGKSLREILETNRVEPRVKKSTEEKEKQQEKERQEKIRKKLEKDRIELEKRTDHLGVVYNSVEDMCKHWNIYSELYRSRLAKGMSKKKALETQVKKKECVKDHKEIIYDTIADMCNHYGISTTTFYHRQKYGWTLEESLEGKQNKVKDHEGNEFSTFKEMCTYWGKSDTVTRHRLDIGWTLKDALVKPSRLEGDEELDKAVELSGLTKSCIRERVRKYNISPLEAIKPEYGVVTCDHKGNIFKNQEEMCKYWGLSKSLYKQRIKDGMTKEEALTTPVKKCGTFVDYLGNEFESFREMASFWKINATTLRSRIKLYGYTKEAFEPEAKVVSDHLQNKFFTRKDMLLHYNITPRMYEVRLKAGYTLKEALTLPEGGKRINSNE